jgi:hypothetical protein
MRLVGEPVTPITRFDTGEIALDRTAIVQSWFRDQSDAELRVAALEYLAVCGTPADLPVIRAELDRGNYRTVGPATDAFIRIHLKQSREDALKAIYELQPESIDQALVTEVFIDPKSFDTSLLLPGATHRSQPVRRAVLSSLVSRKALPLETAEQLLGDTDATVLYQG